MAVRYNASLQENLLAMLAHDDIHGKLIHQLIDVELFEGDYRDLAERCQNYWRKHGEAPKAHTPDLMADILEDPHNRRAPTFRRILTSMFDLSGNLNTDYVLSQLRTFTRLQNLKGAIIRSAETLSAKNDLGISEVEEIWQDLLKTREVAFDPGSRLTDYEKVLEFMQRRSAEFSTGIPALDHRGIIPARGALMLLIAAAKAGKTWALIHLGKRAVHAGKKVAHVSLEIREEIVMQRYYQSIFAVPKHDKGAVKVTSLELDSLGRLTGFGEDRIQPDWSLTGKYASEELESHIAAAANKFENLRIKSFPPNTLSVNGLRAYLDSLELIEGFVPDLLIVDYLGIMKTDPKNIRVSLGHNAVDLRGICSERNIAGVTAHQVNRPGAQHTHVKATDIAEDWSIVGTVDTLLTFSRTDQEKRHGLGRLYVAAGREEADAFAVLLTQNYEIGQFVIQSIPLRSSKYWDLIKDYDDDKKSEYDQGDDEGDDD